MSAMKTETFPLAAPVEAPLSGPDSAEHLARTASSEADTGIFREGA